MLRGFATIVLSIALLSAAAFTQQRGTAVGISKQLQSDLSKNVATNISSNRAMNQKIDPLLRHTLRHAEAHRANPAETVQALSHLLSLKQETSGKLAVSLLVKADDVAAVQRRIELAGGRINTIAGDILTAEMPLDAVIALSEYEPVRFIQISAKSAPQIDVSRVEIGAHLVHAGSGLSQSYTGDGVVVGVLDSGIEWEHEDFDWSNGTSRIQYLWDMSGTGNPPGGYSYGTEYTKANIDAGQCNEIDGDGGSGHGTHVTGTAAGSGIGHPNYVGIAPESDIIFVKGIRDHNSNGGFADGDVVDGCAYIFSKAQQMGQPAVINLSLGGQLGPHDGTSLYEQALDFLSGPGRIIVTAAGNAGNDLIHAGYTAQSGSGYNDALETIWVATGGLTAVDMWYNPGNISVGLAAYDMFGSLIGYTNPVAPGQLVDNMPFEVGGFTYGLVTIDAQTVGDPNNGANRVVVVINSDNGTYPIGDVFWSLYTFGSGSFDAWVITGGNFTLDASTWIVPGNNDKSVGIPSTALKTISIGSYVTKNQWIDITSTVQTQYNSLGFPVTIGAISEFSSHGPSRDGRVQPDVSAPGEAIISALSYDLTLGVGVNASDILWTGKHRKMQGTSMASPHITGVIGLMLERNGTLTPDEARNILKGTARSDGFTGTVPNNIFGSGKVDAYDAVSTVVAGIELIDPALPAAFELAQNYPNPFNPATQIRFAIPRAAKVHLSVYDILGREVAVLVNEAMQPGQYEYEFDARELSSGIYFYRLEAGSFKQVRKMLLAR